jgi:hypothetical protein
MNTGPWFFFVTKPFVLVVTDSVRPTDYSLSDSRVVFTPTPTPYSCSLLSHAHRSMVFFHNQTFALVVADSTRPIGYSLSDSRVVFTQAPTLFSWFSFSHAHRSMSCFHNQTFTLTTADSTRPIDLGILVDSEIVLSSRYGKTRVFINKNLINRDSLSTRPYQVYIGPMLCTPEHIGPRTHRSHSVVMSSTLERTWLLYIDCTHPMLCAT